MPMSPAVPATPLPERLRLGDCVLDLAAQRLTRDGAAVPLAPRYFAVLMHLAGSGGRLVGKDELLDAVWGHRHVSDSVLKVAINAVRAALGDDAKAPRHVETVARRGYRFIGAAPLAAVPPPVPAPATTPRGNLPPVAPGLIGRDDDLARLHDALATQRLVTLQGPGGVGKTRLALAAAGLAAPAAGVWLVRLDALADAEPLRATVARTLGLAAGTEASAASLARALSGLQLRLVLDNAEHLQAAVAELVVALRAGAPGVQLLVTSQVPLRVADEHLLPLAPLALPDADTDRGDSAAVQLLLSRARQQDPALRFDADDARHAAAICRALDGLPLALELAAARVPLLGWAGVRGRLTAGLDERLSLLTRGANDAAARHRTLRAALAWTHGLLAEAEQRALQRLSVFAGSFTVEAAIAVTGGEDAATALDMLDTLRERSLLVRSGDGDAVRWRLYDSVRAFAAEGLHASGERAEALRRWVEHLVVLFWRSSLALTGEALRPWLQRHQPEVDNLRAALQTALADATLQPAGLRLSCASVPFRVRGGWRLDALRDHEACGRLLPGLDAALSPADLAAFDLAHAELSAVGQLLPPLPALAAARRAQVHFRAAGDAFAEHRALLLEASIQMRLQSPPSEREAVLERLRAIEPPAWGPLQRRQRVWQEVMWQRDRGDLKAFEEGCAAYMATGRALGEDNMAWIAAQALAQVMCTQQRLDAAIALLGRTVDQMRSVDELRVNAHVLAQWAALRVTLDASAPTVQALHEAATLMHAEGRLWWMGDALAWLPWWQGRHDDAARVQAWADGLVKQRGFQRGHLFGSVRAGFDRAVVQSGDGARLQTLLSVPSALDESAVLGLVFGAEPGAGAQFSNWRRRWPST